MQMSLGIDGDSVVVPHTRARREATLPPYGQTASNSLIGESPSPLGRAEPGHKQSLAHSHLAGADNNTQSLGGLWPPGQNTATKSP